MTLQEKYLFAKRISEVTSRPINYRYVDKSRIPIPLFIDIDNLQQCSGVDGPCESYGLNNQQNTAYDDDESNWRCLCAVCQEANDSHWGEQWEEYYAGGL